MVGVGSDTSRGSFDNVQVQVLPPQYTLQATEDFNDAQVAFLAIPQSGDWVLAGGRYTGTALAGERAVSLIDLGLASGLQANSILAVGVVVNTNATTGIVFDYYGAGDFKYAGLSERGDTLTIGHFIRGSWVTDATVAISIVAGRDYELALSLKGTTVSVSLKAAGALNWQASVGYVFNAVTVDGAFGLFSKDGRSAFDSVTVKTDDPAFRTGSLALHAASPAPVDGGRASVLTAQALHPLVEAAIARLDETYGLTDAQVALLSSIEFVIGDLEGQLLGETRGNTVWLDADAAGFGWFVDATPLEDLEYAIRLADGAAAATRASGAYGDIDLLSVVAHELGHVLGFGHDAGYAFMDEALAAGVRTLTTQPAPLALLASEPWFTRTLAPGPLLSDQWLFSDTENSKDDDAARKTKSRANGSALSIDWQGSHRGLGVPFTPLGTSAKGAGGGLVKPSSFDFLTLGR
jgi:hypothetical protein